MPAVVEAMSAVGEAEGRAVTLVVTWAMRLTQAAEVVAMREAAMMVVTRVAVGRSVPLGPR